MMGLDVHEMWDVLAAVEAVSRARGGPQWPAIAGKIKAAIEVESGGMCVYRLTLPLEVTTTQLGKKKLRKPLTLQLAPSLNVYSGLQPWTLKIIRKLVDAAIEQGKAQWPRWDCGSTRERYLAEVKRGKRTTKVEKLKVSGGRRRVLEVTRYSSREVDELAIDILGGKIVVDRLTWAGVIAGDARKHIVRRPRWVPVKPGEGRLEIVVFEAPDGAAMIA